MDKYVLLAHGEGGFHPERAARVRARLFERVRYLHAGDTETGARYRMANDLAARFARRLEGIFARHRRFEPMRAALRRLLRRRAGGEDRAGAGGVAPPYSTSYTRSLHSMSPLNTVSARSARRRIARSMSGVPESTTIRHPRIRPNARAMSR